MVAAKTAAKTAVEVVGRLTTRSVRAWQIVGAAAENVPVVAAVAWYVVEQ